MYIVVLLRLDLLSQASWGTGKQAAPLPKEAKCFVGGTGVAGVLFRQGRGSQESRTERSAGREGSSAAVPKTDRATDLGGELIYMNEPTYLAGRLGGHAMETFKHPGERVRRKWQAV